MTGKRRKRGDDEKPPGCQKKEIMEKGKKKSGESGRPHNSAKRRIKRGENEALVRLGGEEEKEKGSGSMFRSGCCSLKTTGGEPDREESLKLP